MKMPAPYNQQDTQKFDHCQETALHETSCNSSSVLGEERTEWYNFRGYKLLQE